MMRRIDGSWQHSVLAPPRRLGAVLTQARARSGESIDTIAQASGLNPSRLASIEAGSVELDDRELAAVAGAYGVDVATVVPPRSELVVDLDEGVLRVDGRRTATEIGEGADRHQVLSRYLALVYSMRDTEPGTKLTLRTDDLDVLGKALRVGRTTLVADLDALMADTTDVVGWRYRLLQRKVLVPAAGILVSFCGAAALIMAPSPGDLSTPAGAEVPAVEVTTTVAPAFPAEVHTAVVQERNPDGTPGPVVERAG